MDSSFDGVKCAVLGAGAWGTAMAIHLANIGHRVFLVSRDVDHAKRMVATGSNGEYISGITFPENLTVSAEFAVARNCEIIFLACPSAGIVEFCRRLQAVQWNRSGPFPYVISLCKGFIPSTSRLPLSAVNKMLPQFPNGVLSGPTHALTVAFSRLTAAVFASQQPSNAVEGIRKALHSPNFHVYASEDVIGVELGGCLKNPYAIGMGMAVGSDCGDNGCAALVTRMVAEMTHIGVALGGKRDTFYGLSGLGDLLATVSGQWSRNRNFGERIGRGESPEEIMQSQRGVVEGYHSTRGFYEICRKSNLTTPILNEIHSVLYEGRKCDKIAGSFMERCLLTS
ncbi:MAG: NAD(P)-dependent glycerol-3-phosphate dehydrogenase [Puniceicoccales bacterium]|jgi:glycerol-3-phosphate dehydrogenase (NAD(P)+)|nr:NAD(P)-dependent glycerol-3-phosphate dehydrogenase [Puniceicoccales bacterium]